jgi:hypothetical protein
MLKYLSLAAMILSACAIDPTSPTEANYANADWINRCVAWRLEVPVRPLPTIVYTDRKLEDPRTGEAVDGIYAPTGAGLVFVVENHGTPWTLHHELMHHYGITDMEMEGPKPRPSLWAELPEDYLGGSRRALQASENFMPGAEAHAG